MSIDVDSCSLCLFKQKLQVSQIMSGYDNKRPLFYCKCHIGWFWYSIGFCICLVKKCHTLQIDFSYFEHCGKQSFHTLSITNHKQCFAEESIHLGIFIIQNICMIGIGCHPTRIRDFRERISSLASHSCCISYSSVLPHGD